MCIQPIMATKSKIVPTPQIVKKIRAEVFLKKSAKEYHADVVESAKDVDSVMVVKKAKTATDKRQLVITPVITIKRTPS